MKSTITFFAKQPHRDAASVRCAGGCGAPLPDISPWRTRWGVLYVHRGCRCAAVWRKVDVRADEIPRRCACGISGPPAGVRATPLGSCSRRSFGPLVCFRRPAPDVSKLPPGPVNKNSQLLAQPAAWSQKGCGEDENRKPSTNPFTNPCRNAFYCVSLQTTLLAFEHFWAIFGPRF